MPPDPAIVESLRQFDTWLRVGPPIVLGFWGLLLLLLDVGLMRKWTSARRRTNLGAIALGGLAVAFFAAYLLIAPISFPWGEGTFTLGVDTTSTDALILGGTLSSDSSVAWLNLIVLGMLALVVGLAMTWDFTEYWGEFYALLLWAAVGMMLLIASAELLTLFLTLELMTICLYLVTALEKGRQRSAEAGLKYFIYGSVSSALFLFGLSLIYGLTGSTRLVAIRGALLAQTGAGLDGNIVGATALLLVLVGFGFKIAAVPFQQWAPDVYEGAPAPAAAWIATGSKVASFIAMIKVFVYALGAWGIGGGKLTNPGWVGILAVIAAVTMTYGNFAALGQRNFKRLLAYSSIAHAGYLLVGVIAIVVSVDGATGASGAVLFYLVVYGIATLGAFAVAAWLAHDTGSDNIDDLAGLGQRKPLMAVCVLILMLSLIGLPPFAGFFGKLYMFMEALNSRDEGKLALTWLVGLGLLNSVVSAFYYVRVLKAMFLRPPQGEIGQSLPRGVAWAVAISTLVTVGFGIWPAGLIGPMKGAAIVPMLSAPVPAGTSEFATRAVDEAQQREIDAANAAKAAANKGRIQGTGPP
jgi:NADH-quinone oxidoreductase subunit N